MWDAALNQLTIGTLTGPLQAISGVVSATSTLSVPYGGTGQTSYTAGNLLYADTATSVAGLTNVATGRVLISQGSSAAPIWSETVTLGTALNSPLIRTNANTSLANFSAGSASGVNNQISAASHQLNGSSNLQSRVFFNGSSSTVLTANASVAFGLVGAQVATEATSGTHDLIANWGIGSAVITNGTAATTNFASLYIDGAATGTFSPTNNYALWVNDNGGGGTVRFDGNVGIGTSTPSSPLSVAGAAYIGGNLTATGTLAVTATATSTFSGPIQSTCFSTDGTTCITGGGATKEIFIYTNSAGGSFPYTVTLNNAALTSASSGTISWFSFFIPNDFTSISDVKVVCIAPATGSVQWDIRVSAGAAGEVYNTHSAASENNSTSLTAERINEIDVNVGSVFSGITAGDYVQASFVNDTANGCRVLGLRFKYQ